MDGNGAHYMGYRLLSGIKNGFVLKFSLLRISLNLSFKSYHCCINFFFLKIKSNFSYDNKLSTSSSSIAIPIWTKISSCNSFHLFLFFEDPYPILNHLKQILLVSFIFVFFKERTELQPDNTLLKMLDL